MAFRTVQPMFGTGTIFTPQSNFFVDYMYARIKLTNQKNRELAQQELAGLSQDSRQLKDEEVRLRQNITNLQRSLLNREQAYISRSYRQERNRSSGSTGRGIQERNRLQEEKESKEKDALDNWNRAQAQTRKASEDYAQTKTSFERSIRASFRTDQAGFFDPNNGVAQAEMQRFWTEYAGGKDPTADDGLYTLMMMYEHIRREYGADQAESFKKAVFDKYDVAPELYTTPLMMNQAGQGQTSLQEEALFYDRAYLDNTVVAGINESYRQQIASVPMGGGGGGGGASAGRTLEAPSSATADETRAMIEEYQTRLKEIQTQRAGLKGQRGEIIERRFGQKGLAESLTPFTRTDPEVDRILDEILGIEDPAVQSEVLADTRMMIGAGRESIAPEFVENEILNESALRGHMQEAQSAMIEANRARASYDAQRVVLSRERQAFLDQYRQMQEAQQQYQALQQSPNASAEALAEAKAQFERLSANVENNRMRYEALTSRLNEVNVLAARAEEQMQVQEQAYDQLRGLVSSPRGVASGWSNMSGQERMLVIQALNSSGASKAENLENSIEATREEIRLLEGEVQTLEQDERIGARGSRMFRRNDAAMDTLNELEETKAALQGLLAQQNQSIVFAGQAQQAAQQLVQTDPDYVLRGEAPPAGLGTPGPIMDVLTPEQEESVLGAAGTVGQREGERRAAAELERTAPLGAEAASRRARGEISDLANTIASVEEAKRGHQANLAELAFFDPQLASSSDTENLQKKMNQFFTEYGLPTIKEDGLYGSETEQAIETYGNYLQDLMRASDSNVQDLQREIDAKVSAETRDPVGDDDLLLEDLPASVKGRELGGVAPMQTPVGDTTPEIFQGLGPDAVFEAESPEDLQESLDYLGRLEIPTGGRRYRTPPITEREVVEAARSARRQASERDAAEMFDVTPTVEDFEPPDDSSFGGGMEYDADFTPGGFEDFELRPAPLEDIVEEPAPADDFDVDDVVFKEVSTEAFEEAQRPKVTVTSQPSIGMTTPSPSPRPRGGTVFKPQDEAFLASQSLAPMLEEIPQGYKDHPSLVLEPQSKLWDPLIRKSYFYDLGTLLTDLAGPENYEGEHLFLTGEVRRRLAEAYRLQEQLANRELTHNNVENMVR